MCLTLANAATIHHHTPSSSTGARGYTATAHHAGHLTPPGDQWRPLPDQQPRTVVTDHHPPPPCGIRKTAPLQRFGVEPGNRGKSVGTPRQAGQIFALT